MMSACGSKRLTSFSPAGTASPARTRRSVWARMRSIKGRVLEPGAPGLGGEAGAGSEAPGGFPHGRQGGAGGREELLVELHSLRLAAAVSDRHRALLGEPAMVAPGEGRRIRQGARPLQ